MAKKTVSKEKWMVVPFKGLGPIRLGASKAAVVKLLGAPSKIKKSSTPGVENLIYNRLDLNIKLRKNCVEQISVATLNKNEICFSDLNIFEDNHMEVMRAFEKAGKPAYESDGFVMMPKIGIATSIHEKNKGDRALSIFKKGSWDDIIEMDRDNGDLQSITFKGAKPKTKPL